MIGAKARLSCLCFSIGLLLALSTLGFPAYAASPDITVDSIWLERASAPQVPVAGTDLSPTEPFNIVASIKNLGQETASGYYLDVYYDSDYGRGGPDNIAPGEVQQWYVGPLTATVGSHVTQWVLDPDSQIAELNEQNNIKQYVFTVGSGESQTTSGTTGTVTTTVTETATSYAYGTTTTTVTSYTGTETSVSTIVVPTTVTLAPLAATSTLQTTRVLTSTGTVTVTGYTTTTLTGYTGTETSVSTIVVPTTVTIGASATVLTVQRTQLLVYTSTTTVTGYTTATVTGYTSTQTSTSTRVVYTTVTKSGAGGGASSPMAYLGFVSLLGVTVGHRIVAGKGRRIMRTRSLYLGFRFHRSNGSAVPDGSVQPDHWRCAIRA